MFWQHFKGTHDRFAHCRADDDNDDGDNEDDCDKPEGCDPDDEKPEPESCDDDMIAVKISCNRSRNGQVFLILQLFTNFFYQLFENLPISN